MCTYVCVCSYIPARYHNATENRRRASELCAILSTRRGKKRLHVFPRNFLSRFFFSFLLVLFFFFLSFFVSLIGHTSARPPRDPRRRNKSRVVASTELYTGSGLLSRVESALSAFPSPVEDPTFPPPPSIHPLPSFLRLARSAFRSPSDAIKYFRANSELFSRSRARARADLTKNIPGA